MSFVNLKRLHKNITEKALTTMRKKNADYTGESLDPLFNFKQSEHLGICSTEQGIVIRIMDKISRVLSFLQKGVLEVEDEKVEDTIEDAINYLILLLFAIKQRKGEFKNVEDQ